MTPSLSWVWVPRFLVLLSTHDKPVLYSTQLIVIRGGPHTRPRPLYYCVKLKSHWHCDDPSKNDVVGLFVILSCGKEGRNSLVTQDHIGVCHIQTNVNKKASEQWTSVFTQVGDIDGQNRSRTRFVVPFLPDESCVVLRHIRKRGRFDP